MRRAYPGAVLTDRSVAGRFTCDEVDGWDTDGLRVELLDGMLLVNAAPGGRHQWLAPRLWRVLDDACPPDLAVMIAPFEWRLGPDTRFEPDLLVTAKAALSEARLEGVSPLLAVEVRSPSTAAVDATLKRHRYQQAGVASYWMVDPDEPGLVALDLVDGRYTEVARAAGDETARLVHPFPVDVVPARLLDGWPLAR